MELELSTEQEILRATAAKFVERYSLDVVRELLSSDEGLPEGYLRQAADLGWFSMLVPEAHGGGSVSGSEVRDLAIVAEERGRGLHPGPFISMNIVAATVARCCEEPILTTILPKVMSGNYIATWAFSNTMFKRYADNGLSFAKSGDQYELNGCAEYVQEGNFADWLLVTAKGESGVSQFLVERSTPGVFTNPLSGHDITQRYASVAFDSVKVAANGLVGLEGNAEADFRRQSMYASVLVCCETLGVLDVLFEMTRQYSLDRIAFGRPIGSFQAIKHQLADMSLLLETGQAVTASAVRAVQEERSDASEIVSIAKSWVGDTGIDIAQGCFQVFGGIGYTWEHDLHLFLRRITMNSLLFGGSDWHRENVFIAHGL